MSPRPALVMCLVWPVLWGCKGAKVPAGDIAAAAAVAVASEIVSAAASRGESGGTYDPEEGRPAGKPRVLDVEHAREVLLRTNVSGCWAAGAPHTPGYVTVTFSPNGTVRHVSVSRPAGSTFDAECVTARLRDVIIDPYDDTQTFGPSLSGPDNGAGQGVVRVTYGEP